MKLSIEMKAEANQITIKITGADWAACQWKDFYQTELQIQEIVARIGQHLTAAAMAHRDAPVLRLDLGGEIYYRKGTPSIGHYKTLYGDLAVERYLYQTAQGGKTLCPMEHYCQMTRFGSATPLLAEVLAFKVSAMTPREAAADLEKCHRATAAPSYIEEMAQKVGALAVAKKEPWTLSKTGTNNEPVAVVATGMDGTTIPIVEENYKMAMVGTIALYNEDEERLRTEYLGAMPEEGKASFYQGFDWRVDSPLARHPQAMHVVLCDGERAQWDHVETKYPNAIHILDFCHASDHLSAAGDLIFGRGAAEEKTTWYERQCHRLKTETGGAARVLRELMRRRDKIAGRPARAAQLDKELTYFHNNAHRMDYALYIALGLPIGSGVTEAACKTVIKQRFCRSGMKWKRESGATILQLRVIRLSNQWDTFWFKVMRYVA